MNNNFFSNITTKLDNILLIKEDSDTVTGEDIIRVNVPAFLRIIELVREGIDDDVPLHYLTEILTRLSKTGAVTMQDYDTIYNYTMQTTNTDIDEAVEMCPDACCGKPVTECSCGPDCKHCDCYEKNKAMNEDKKKSPAGGPACWDGKKIHPTKPTKIKGGKRVNNCIDDGK